MLMLCFFLFFILSQDIRQQSCELPCKVAKLPENKNRNRYRDVSPCELLFCLIERSGDNRVKYLKCSFN